jgi:vitamin B12 transporter
MVAHTHWRAVLLLALVPAFVNAQPAPEEDAVVVTASRTEQRIRDAIPHTTVLTQKDIRDSQAIDLPSLLRSEAGFELQQNGGVGSTFSPLSLRGGSSAQALILVDGVRIEDVSFGQSAIQHIMLDEVERIEIVRGNASSLYGSGAIGGVVQVFTKRGRGAPAPYGQATLGSRNTGKLLAGYGGQVSDTRFNVTVSRFETRGFSAIDPRIAPSANPDPDGYRNESMAGSLSHTLFRRHELGVSFLKARTHLDYDTAFNPPTDSHESGQDLGMMQAWWEARLVDPWRSRVTVAEGTDYRTDTRNGLFAFSSNTRNRQLIWDNEVRLTPAHTVSIGIEQLRQELASSTVGERFREVEALRLGYLGRLGVHSLQGNARTESYSDFGKAETYFLGYGVDLTDAWRFTASTATAFRAPTFVDLYFPFGVGNPLLRPERARTNELGLQWASGAHRVKAVAFETDYQDAIVFSAGTTRNVRRASVNGFETSYSGHLLGFDLRASLTVQDPVEQDPGGQELQAIRRSKAFGSLAAYRTLGAWRLGAQLAGAGERRDTHIVTFASVQEAGYTMLNLTARYNFSKALFAALRVENALDEDYHLVHGFNAPPRGVFLTVGWQP